MMHSETYLPSPALSPFIKNYLVIESQGELVNRVLPGTSLVMAFRFRGHVSYIESGGNKSLPATAISGVRKSGRLINYAKNSANLLVIFKETGAQPFIREPLHELFSLSQGLDELNDYRDLSSVEDQLAEAGNNRQRIGIIEQFLLSRRRNHSPDKLVAAAMENIRISKGTIRIKALADGLCISQDAFEKRFRKAAGVSPKQFSFIVRMHSIIHSGLKNESLAQTAFSAGYFDQPHFNKDFKLFTGQTPTDFLKSPVFW